MGDDKKSPSKGDAVHHPGALPVSKDALEILELSGLMLVILDKDAKVIHINKKAGEVLGLDMAKAVGMVWIDSFVPVRDREKVWGEFNALRNGTVRPGSYDTFENHVQCMGGADRLLLWHNTIYLDDDGRFAGTISTAIDRTELKTVAEALTQSEDDYHDLIQGSSDLVFLLDRELKVLKASQAALSLLQLKAGDVVGRRLFEGDLFSGVDPDTMDSMLACARSGLQVDLKGVTVTDRSGRERIVDIRGLPTHGRGKDVGMALLIRDVTDRKLAEEQLAENARHEIIQLILYALPVFANSVAPSIRDVMVRTFTDRFEAFSRPRFEKQMAEKGDASSRLKGIEARAAMLKAYLQWLEGLFTRFGADVRIDIAEDHGVLECLNCPWAATSGRNPIFCLFDRAMIIRSYSWTDFGSNVAQISSIADGAPTCNFEFRTKRPSKHSS